LDAHIFFYITSGYMPIDADMSATTSIGRIMNPSSFSYRYWIWPHCAILCISSVNWYIK